MQTEIDSGEGDQETLRVKGYPGFERLPIRIIVPDLESVSHEDAAYLKLDIFRNILLPLKKAGIGAIEIQIASLDGERTRVFCKNLGAMKSQKAWERLPEFSTQTIDVWEELKGHLRAVAQSKPDDSPDFNRSSREPVAVFVATPDSPYSADKPVLRQLLIDVKAAGIPNFIDTSEHPLDTQFQSRFVPQGMENVDWDKTKAGFVAIAISLSVCFALAEKLGFLEGFKRNDAEVERVDHEATLDGERRVPLRDGELVLRIPSEANAAAVLSQLTGRDGDDDPTSSDAPADLRLRGGATAELEAGGDEAVAAPLRQSAPFPRVVNLDESVIALATANHGDNDVAPSRGEAHQPVGVGETRTSCDTVFYAYGSAALGDEGRERLRVLFDGSGAEGYAITRVGVTSHASIWDSAANNLKMTDQRNDSVVGEISALDALDGDVEVIRVSAGASEANPDGDSNDQHTEVCVTWAP